MIESPTEQYNFDVNDDGTIQGDISEYYRFMADFLRELKEKMLEGYIPPTEEEIIQDHMDRLSAASPILPGNDIRSLWR